MTSSSTEIIDKPARERILLTAHDLFYRDGIRATGIDKVIAEYGVSKVTFYRHFPSKNRLVTAFLDYRHRLWISWFADALHRHGATPGGGLTPIVAVMREWFDKPIFRGCAFINVTAELGDSFPEAIDQCHSHKQDMLTMITELLPESPQRAQIASAAAVAVDGAIFKAQLEKGNAGSDAALGSLKVILAALEKAAESC
jgi:AcrR family transcriptional regulator